MRCITSSWNQYRSLMVAPYIFQDINSSNLLEIDISNLYGYVRSNPNVYVDPSGQVPQAILGCLGGGALSGAARGINCIFGGEKSCGRKTACAAAAGCIAGGITAQFPFPAGACVGSVLGAASEALCNAAFGDPINSCVLAEALITSIVGCMSGLVPAADLEDGIRGTLIGAYPGLFGGCVEKLGNAFGTGC